ncbi:MAG: efflux RND transporter permease subunit, partial [Pirellulales bacterium]|nr:efflux RND transporter permease subunit [Pirellulales bacterium]
WSHPKLTTLYRSSLEAVFRRPVWGILLGLTLPVVGFIESRKLPEQFFPPADRDQFQIELEMPANTSLEQTLSTVKQVRETVLKHNQVQRLSWFVGESAPSFYYNVIPRRKNTPYYAQALVQLKSETGVRELIHKLQGELNELYPVARILVRQLEQGPMFDAPIEVQLFGPDVEELHALGDRIRCELSWIPDVVHTGSEMGEVLPKLAIHVDEEKALCTGLNNMTIAGQLNMMLEGSLGGSVLEGTEELPVRVRAAKTARSDVNRVASLDLLPLVSTPGDPYPGVPLTVLANIKLEPETVAIPRLNGRRMNEVKAFLKAGVLPAEVLEKFQQKLAEKDFQLPPGYSLKYGGETQRRDEALGDLMNHIGVLLVLMAATLVLSFRSFRIAGLIAVVAVLSIGLGLGALRLYGFPFGFMAIVGTMGLVGVAINDTIVVMAALRGDPRARQGDLAGICEVVNRSTRHIVATSLTTMAGFTPLVISGGGFWPPLAIAIAGGVGGATILALYFAPSAYILLMCRLYNAGRLGRVFSMLAIRKNGNGKGRSPQSCRKNCSLATDQRL